MKTELQKQAEKLAVKNSYVRNDLKKFLETFAEQTESIKNQYELYIGMISMANPDDLRKIAIITGHESLFWKPDYEDFREYSAYLDYNPETKCCDLDLLITREIEIKDLRRLIKNIPKILQELRNDIEKKCNENDDICSYLTSLTNCGM